MAIFAGRMSGVLAAALWCALAAPSAAQTWPQKTVKIIVPLPAGTGMDAGLRIYADRLSQMWGQPVVVENRPGAEGVIAVSSFVKAKDDHQLLYSYGGPISISPVTTKDLPYDPGKDLVAITQASDNVLGIALSAAHPATSLKELEAWARAHPGAVNWTATAGLPQFVFENWGKSLKLDMTYVPYKDVGPVLQDMKANRIQIYVTGVATFRPLLLAGDARLLAVLNRERFPTYPDAPTAAQAGFPVLTGDGFNGFFGNADMKPDVRDKIAADVRAIAADPQIREKLTGLAQIARAAGPDEFVKLIEAQRRQIADIVKP